MKITLLNQILIVSAILYGVNQTFSINNKESNDNYTQRNLEINNLPELILKIDKKTNNVKFQKKRKFIKLESVTNKGKIIEKINIGEKTSYLPFYKNTPLVGDKTIKNYTVKMYEDRESLKKITSKIFVEEDKKNIIEIDDKLTIINKYKSKYGKDIRINSNDIKLVYYKPENLNRLIPMYQIGNENSGPQIKNTNLLGMYYPANSKYDNNFNITNLKLIKLNEFKKKESIRDENNEIIEISLSKYYIEFESNIKLNLEKLSIINNYQTIKKEIKNNKYIIEFITNLDRNKNILLNYQNIYDVPKTIEIIYNKKESIFPFIKPSFTLPDLQSRDNNDWGIEWGENEIGGSCYSNFVNYMNEKTNSVLNYQWVKPNAWVKDFIDKDNAGLDNYYIDSVDLSVYIGHGNGYGFDLEGSGVNNGSLTYNEAKKGKAWGNIDLEFHAWLSCQVLEETYDGELWWQRWGPTFNGLHLICGFETNASVGTHKHLKYFAKNIHQYSKTIKEAWFDAADDDQPDDTRAVVMGPLITNVTKNNGNYKSISSSISNLHRAYWNDKIWGRGDPGDDISKDQVAGWWRVVYTV